MHGCVRMECVIARVAFDTTPLTQPYRKQKPPRGILFFETQKIDHRGVVSDAPTVYRYIELFVLRSRSLRLLQTRTNGHNRVAATCPLLTSKRCADEEWCELLHTQLIAHKLMRVSGRECRCGCGGRLYDLCGGVENPGIRSNKEGHRIFHTCFRRRSLSNPAKRRGG